MEQRPSPKGKQSIISEKKSRIDTPTEKNSNMKKIDSEDKV